MTETKLKSKDLKCDRWGLLTTLGEFANDLVTAISEGGSIDNVL